MTSTNSVTSRMVIEHYSALAREDASNNAAHIKKVAESFGYDPEDLAAIPEGANLGLSCGNPLAVAGLKSVRSLAFNIHLRSAYHVPAL
jgi:arsenite methyltransferase